MPRKPSARREYQEPKNDKGAPFASCPPLHPPPVFPGDGSSPLLTSHRAQVFCRRSCRWRPPHSFEPDLPTLAFSSLRPLRILGALAAALRLVFEPFFDISRPNLPPVRHVFNSIPQPSGQRKPKSREKMSPSSPLNGPARWLAALVVTSSLLSSGHAQYYKVDTPGICYPDRRARGSWADPRLQMRSANPHELSPTT